MLYVCYQCGLYRADKTIDPLGPYALCPECGYQHPFQYMSLLIVSGASGTGKSTICNQLVGHIREAVLLDSDILWRPEFNQPENEYRDFFETWLRVCKNISQSGRSVVLFGAGIGVPENLENCIERRYFSEIKYLSLICEPEILGERLTQRPAWRGTQNSAYIEEHQLFNQWFIRYNAEGRQPPISILDTSYQVVEETAQEVQAWIRQYAS